MAVEFLISAAPERILTKKRLALLNTNPGKTISIAYSLLTLALCTGTAQANLISMNSEATVASDATLVVWNVDGGLDNVFLSNFYFRTDDTTSANGGELTIAGLGTVTETQLGPNAVSYFSANEEISAQQTWSLTGGARGSGDSSIEAAITFSNLTSSVVPLSLFYAADFDIAFDPTAPNDETTALNDRSVEVVDPDALARILTTISFPADSYQVYDSQFEVLLNFNADLDGPTLLSNAPGFGTTVFDMPGVTDAGFAFGWTIDLSPGESFTATALQVYTAVPVPTTLGLFGVGLACLNYSSKRRKGGRDRQWATSKQHTFNWTFSNFWPKKRIAL